MLITATELKTNIGKYLSTAETEDVYITRNGKIIAKLSSPANDRQSILDGLVGIAAANPITVEQARAERLSRQ